MQQRQVIAALLAGGTGSRMRSLEPKQFLMVEGRMVIERSVEAFEQHEGVDHIIIVSHPDHVERVRSIVASNGWNKVRAVVAGGKERYHSSLAAIEACRQWGDDAFLILHDAARPFVSRDIISRVVAHKDVEALGVGVPVTDTLWQVSDGVVAEVPPRSPFYQAQTPQAFRLSIIRQAYARAMQDPSLQATDDIGVVRNYTDVPVTVVAGEPENKKITYPSDL